MMPLDPGYVYVAEFNNGVVKVGTSIDPKRRSRQIAKDMRCNRGVIVRMWTKHTNHSHVFERFGCLMALRLGAEPGRYGKEWFASGDYDRIVHAIDAHMTANENRDRWFQFEWWFRRYLKSLSAEANIQAAA